MRLKIEVTQDDIRLGKRKKCMSCPVSRATKRALTNASGLAKISVATTDDCLLIDEPGSNVGYIYLPQKVGTFIEKFDNRKPVKPFSFVIEV